MTGKKKKALLIGLAVCAAVSAVLAISLSRTSLVENVKRESARLFEYEYIPNQNVDIDRCEAALAFDSIYKDFRKKYRFHYQTIGMASFADSSRMIMLSELPPHFETDSIASIFSQFRYKTEQRKHTIGYDGYVTDMVILLGNATKENCDNLVKRLNKELFFSEYKPTVTTLPVENKRQYFVKDNIDYQITLDEFNTWFMEDGEGFVKLDDTSKVMTVSDFFSSKSRGVYFSRLPGFVAWAVAKNEDIAGQIDEIRQFTLDADLILGALSDSSTLVIIGRERQAALYQLPPLQAETILLLASTTEKELSQSLDVNDLMAGKMSNGRDWCPTYLSRELENTEFGDLMTITDVLLKDWSERGTIQESHYRYPEPGYYPFDRPLFRKLGLNELVYNWNTANAMYAIDCDNYTIYTLNRTGSLPVSYFNSQERSQSIGYRYESQAYHYFATLGNTDLARVVQYTALYQLFIDNNISYSGNTYPSFPKNKPFLLYKPTTDLLNTIRQMSGEEVTLFVDSVSLRLFEGYQKKQVDNQLRDHEKLMGMTYSDDEIERIYSNVKSNIKTRIGNILGEVRSMLNLLSEDKFKQLAKYLSYPRGMTLRGSDGYSTYVKAKKVNQLLFEVGKNNLDLIGMDLANVKNYFARNLSGNSGRYTKTSSLIVTFNDMVTTGGHNLSSRISRVNSMTHYKRSRGNYTPTDYERPAESTEPSAGGKPEVESRGNDGGQPHVATKTSKGSTKTPKPQTGAKKQQVAKNGNTRPRSSVISASPRTTRGL